jgi:hypothetical protein
MTTKNSPIAIRDILITPSRFLRSTNLEKDFADSRALDSYTMTPFVADAFRKIIDGASSGSGRRAWRITGDYGVGKSSFALLVAQYLAHANSRPLTALLKEIGGEKLPRTRKLLPVLVTGEREGLIRAVVRSIRATFFALPGRRTKLQASLIDLAAKVAKSGSPSDFTHLLDGVVEVAHQDGAGILLILDEMGKFLEHAANQPEREDIFVLQNIAERAARSGNKPFLFLGLLHQGFHAYAEGLPFAQRHEWEKVAGRFEELVFDQPLVHTAALVARALGVATDTLPKDISSEARALIAASTDCGWFGRTRIKEPATLYPLHPMVLPVLIRFFARFGQHERSLFGFLLSNESFGLQSFAEKPLQAGSWYSIADFFDYVRAVFGHRLAGESYRSSWLRLIELVDGVQNLGIVELEIVKTIAILNLIDADDLVATEAVLGAAINNSLGSDLHRVLKDLVKRGVLFRRGQAGGYRLWSASSVNLDSALNEAFKAIGETNALAEQLARHLDRRPIAARKHYLKTGTLRYFEVRYCPTASLEVAADAPAEADGFVIVALPQTEGERKHARLVGEGLQRNDAILVIPGVLSAFSADLRDIKAWQFVIDNTGELADDPFALSEADRQLKRASERLSTNLEAAVGLRSGLAQHVEVYRKGSTIKFGKDRQLAGIISSVCDDVYTQAPLIMNELLNRNVLSSAAAAARMRLIEGMFTSADQIYLGIDETKSPPEKSMYLSVLSKGNMHRKSKERYFVDEPPKDDDPLRLRPALAKIMASLESAKGARVAVTDIFNELRTEPFGVRDGVAPLLLAVVVSTKAHEIALYESGTFLHKFGPSDFLRLTKQPETFECQLCRVVGVRGEVFRRLLEVFSDETPKGRSSDLLDVVTPLCRFAAQLPEFTRRSTSVGRVAARVRDALLTSRDPSSLIFTELPVACDSEPFDQDIKRSAAKIDLFVATLRLATEELRDAYPTLLTKIVSDVAKSLGAGGSNFDRVKLAARAASVSLAAKEPRLRAFSLRLRDPGLSEDAWIESLASFVVSKPPTKWSTLDRGNWETEIASLGETFQRVEATAYPIGREPRKSAVRIGITHADGREIARVIETDPEAEEEIGRIILSINKILLSANEDRLAILYRMLWAELQGRKDQDGDPDEAVRSQHSG